MGWGPTERQKSGGSTGDTGRAARGGTGRQTVGVRGCAPLSVPIPHVPSHKDSRCRLLTLPCTPTPVSSRFSYANATLSVATASPIPSLSFNGVFIFCFLFLFVLTGSTFLRFKPQFSF